MNKTNTEIRWGLVGAGDVCERKSGPPLYQLPGHTLVALTRRDAEKGKDFARRHAGTYVPDYEDLLALPEINAVYIATPCSLHAVQTLRAARAGKHVLVEKPMADCTADCREMIDTCARAGVRLGVAYYRRAYPAVLAARTWLRENRMGRLMDISLNEQFPTSHRLDLVHFLAGDFDTVRTEIGQENTLHLHGITRAGAAVTMELGWRERPATPEQIRLTGEDGEIQITDLKGGAASLTSHGKTEAFTFPSSRWTHSGLIENFGRALTEDAPLACDGAEALKSTVLLDLLSALEPGGPAVRVDYDHPPSPDPVRARKYNMLG